MIWRSCRVRRSRSSRSSFGSRRLVDAILPPACQGQDQCRPAVAELVIDLRCMTYPKIFSPPPPIPKIRSDPVGRSIVLVPWRPDLCWPGPGRDLERGWVLCWGEGCGQIGWLVLVLSWLGLAWVGGSLILGRGGPPDLESGAGCVGVDRRVPEGGRGARDVMESRGARLAHRNLDAWPFLRAVRVGRSSVLLLPAAAWGWSVRSVWCPVARSTWGVVAVHGLHPIGAAWRGHELRRVVWVRSAGDVGSPQGARCRSRPEWCHRPRRS